MLRILLIHPGYTFPRQMNHYEVTVRLLNAVYGVECETLVCGGAYTACGLASGSTDYNYNTVPQKWKKDCKGCQTRLLDRISTFSSTIQRVQDWITPDDAARIRQAIEELPNSFDIGQFINTIEFNGINLGADAWMSTQYHLHMGTPDRIHLVDKSILMEYLWTAYMLSSAMNNLIRNRHYHLVLANEFNYVDWGIPVRMALNHKIPMLCTRYRDIWGVQNIIHGVYRSVNEMYSNYYSPDEVKRFKEIRNSSLVSTYIAKGQKYIEHYMTGKQAWRTGGEKYNIQSSNHHCQKWFRPNRKTVVVFAHLCWDAALFYGNPLFHSFEQWLEYTYKTAINVTQVDWLFRPHPYEINNINNVHLNTIVHLNRLQAKYPCEHIRVMDAEAVRITSFELIPYMHAGVTSAGTVCFELPAHGIPCIAAARSGNAAQPFAISAQSISQYEKLLQNIADIHPPLPSLQETAQAYAGFIFDKERFLDISELFDTHDCSELMIDSTKLQLWCEKTENKEYIANILNDTVQHLSQRDELVQTVRDNEADVSRCSEPLIISVQPNIHVCDLYQYAVRPPTQNINNFKEKLRSGYYKIYNFPCPVCENDSQWLVTAVSNEGFMWSICKKCGLFQINKRLNKAGLEEFYATGEYTDIITAGLGGAKRFRLDYFSSGFGYLKSFYKLGVDLSKLNILDIGCGSGGIIAFLKDHGAKVKGFDLDEKKVAFGRKYIEEIEVKDALNCDFQTADHNVILLGDVLEHLHDPKYFLDRLWHKMDTNALLVISVPNLTYCEHYTRGSSFTKFLHLGHIWYFTPVSAERLLNNAGFYIITLASNNSGMKLICKKSIQKIHNESNGFWISKSAVDISDQFWEKEDKYLSGMSADNQRKMQQENSTETIRYQTKRNHLLHDQIYVVFGKCDDLHKKEILMRLNYYIPDLSDRNVIFSDTITKEIAESNFPVLIFNLPKNKVPVSSKRLFDIDFNTNHADGWQWAHLTSYCYPQNETEDAVLKRFSAYLAKIKKRNPNKAYIFGTGPSLEKAIHNDWSDGYKIVCNTIVKDKILWNHIKPDFIVAGDAIYHFGHTAFAEKFREDLRARLAETETMFLYPLWFDIIAKRELADFHERLIPVKVGSHSKIWGDLTKDFSLPGVGNVLNLLLLPLACTLSKHVCLWGFDGRAPDDQLFWANSPKHTYPELIQTLKAAHPAFFNYFVPESKPGNYVKDVHGDKLDQSLTEAEKHGYRFFMMHKSWTETLNKRFRVPESAIRSIQTHPEISSYQVKATEPNLVDRQIQILLAQNFRQAASSDISLPSFSDVEFSSYSQNGEDGILLFIFSIIGCHTKKVVEVCAGDGIECNAANLIVNHGWAGLLFDGDRSAIERGKSFYAKRTNAWRFRRIPPVLVHAWITSENVDDLIQQYGMFGDIDLLSLDMDGTDYWIWKAIKCVMPRVVVLEYNNRWSSHQSLTVPYSNNFVGIGATQEGEGYFGASLPAFVKLGKEKGYRLIGANSPNTNAFFMRNDVGEDTFPEVTADVCLSSDYAVMQHRTKYPLIKNKPIVEV